MGCHPKGLTFMLHAKDHTRVAPSQALRLIPEASGSYRIEEIWYSHGHDLPASSAAVAAEGLLYIGAVHADGFLACKLE